MRVAGFEQDQKKEPLAEFGVRTTLPCSQRLPKHGPGWVMCLQTPLVHGESHSMNHFSVVTCTYLGSLFEKVKLASIKYFPVNSTL